MATQAEPLLTGPDAQAIIDPANYVDWDALLDRFDRLRSETPVVKVVNDEIHDPFWLVTSYDDVMRISKDNKLFLNSPRSVTFSDKNSGAFVKSITGGDPNLVRSLVALDAPTHPQYRRLTQDWFMPKNIRQMEDEISALASSTVDRLVDAGGEADFVPLVSAPYPLHVVMQILGADRD